MKIRIGIACTEYNENVVEKMLDCAIAHAEFLNAEIASVIRVPGAWDLPLAVKALLENESIDAVACLGAVTQGETSHDEAIAFSTSYNLQKLALLYEKPIGFGVSGPRMTLKQAENRAETFAKHAIKTAIEMHKTLETIKIKEKKE